jgi:hypothetical protein
MPQSYKEVKGVAQTFVASKMFSGIASDSQAFTKILAGMELGIAPFAAMRAVHVIQGQATLSANVMAAMVKRSGRYDYRVLKKEQDQCVIEFFEIRDGKRESVGKETFDQSEAEAAKLTGKDNWRAYPKAMMFARCMSNGVRTYCPDVFNGMSIYTPDELGGKVNHDGEFIDGEVVEVATPVQAPAIEGAPEPVAAATTDEPIVEAPEPQPSRADRKASVQEIEAELEAKVMKTMTDDKGPTDEQLDMIRELRKELGYKESVTEGKLKLVKTKDQAWASIKKLEQELEEAGSLEPQVTEPEPAA